MEIEEVQISQLLTWENEETVAECEVWARLPEELIAAILVLLPVPSLMRAAIVCKRWRSVLNSAWFKLKCSRVPAQHPWLVAVSYKSSPMYRAYSPADDVWYALSLPEVSRADLVAGAQGLLCFENMDDQFGQPLLVFDPITKQITRLPKLGLCLETREQSVALDVVEHSCPVVYRVVLLSSEPGVGPNGRFGNVTRIFDSDVGSWRVSTSEFPSQEMSVMSHAVSGGNVYCLLGRGYCFPALRLVAYDISRDAWTEIGTRGLPSFELCRLTLVSCQGELKLVFSGERRVPQGMWFYRVPDIRVFRMNNLSREWSELPNTWASKELQIWRTLRSAVGGYEGEVYILLSARDSGELLQRYDQSAGTWKTVAYPCAVQDSLQNMVCFEPRWGLSMKT